MRDELFREKRRKPGFKTRRTFIVSSIISFIALSTMFGVTAKNTTTSQASSLTPNANNLNTTTSTTTIPAYDEDNNDADNNYVAPTPTTQPATQYQYQYTQQTVPRRVVTQSSGS